MKVEKKKSLGALLAAVFSAGVGAQEIEDSAGTFVLEEIIVTATRRETNINDTAASIAALSRKEMVRRNLAGMADYLNAVPGVNYISLGGVGSNLVVIRGITSDPGTEKILGGPSVGSYFGEAPLTGLGFLGGTVDPKLVDMARIEILRGPQGTLFGSGSLSGTLRQIPISPNLQELEGSITADYSNTTGNGSDNTKLEGVINIPVVDDIFAVRAVAYSHDDSGYFDNIAGSDPGLIGVATGLGGGGSSS